MYPPGPETRVPLRLSPLLVAGSLLLGLAGAPPSARAELSPELRRAIAETRAAHPQLLVLRDDDAFLAAVDEAALRELLDAIAAGHWSPSLETSIGVVIEGFSRAQGPAATYGRNLLGRVAGLAAESGDRETLRGTARVLGRFLEDLGNSYSILAQQLLSEKVRCGAASIGDQELIDRVATQVNPDRGFQLEGTDGTVADRYGLHQRADLVSVAARGERVVAVGYFGTVVVSQDGGESWEAPDTGTDEPLYAVAFGSDEEIWAGGRGGVLLRSADGGRTWTRRPTPFARHLFGLYAKQPDSVLAVGDFGLQLRTDDAGAHWRCVPREGDVILGRIAPAGEDAVLVGEFGTLERLPDGEPPGRRGALEGIPEDAYLFDVWFDASGRTGVAVGLEGTVARSEDGGATWTRVAAPLRADLYGVGGVGQRVVVVGEGGFVAVSDDAGRTFAPAERPSLPRPILDVEVDHAGRAFAVGGGGLVLGSDDAGASFRVIRTGETR